MIKKIFGSNMSSSSSAKKRRNTLFSYTEGDDLNIKAVFTKNCYYINKKGWLFSSDARHLNEGKVFRLTGINKRTHLIKG